MSGLAAVVIADLDMTLVELHCYMIVVSIVQQDAVILRCGHLQSKRVQRLFDISRSQKGSVCTQASCSVPLVYLQGDVGLWPVLEVREQEVGVSVDKVDADQLLAARTPELRRTLAEGPPASLHTRGPWGRVFGPDGEAVMSSGRLEVNWQAAKMPEDEGYKQPADCQHKVLLGGWHLDKWLLQGAVASEQGYRGFLLLLLGTVLRAGRARTTVSRQVHSLGHWGLGTQLDGSSWPGKTELEGSQPQERERKEE
ncbi:hypothetical protein EYF80_014533 [Liparis tanakae]|uniref:Uncharacterized protein n=1 Tax=Liparis tanakae TaxID=230148 RepID=A0A4Z2IBD0_9TELE|nr:hypothetical protein EYF80_014533 [Liparis tanakae]